MSGLPDSIMHGCDLATVAEAISRAAPIRGPVYVERRGVKYRWSPTHRGGPYPLLRETAKLLALDHHTIVLPFRQLEGTELTVIPASPGSDRLDAWALVDVPDAAGAAAIARRIRTALNN